MTRSMVLVASLVLLFAACSSGDITDGSSGSGEPVGPTSGEPADPTSGEPADPTLGDAAGPAEVTVPPVETRSFSSEDLQDTVVVDGLRCGGWEFGAMSIGVAYDSGFRCDAGDANLSQRYRQGTIKFVLSSVYTRFTAVVGILDTSATAYPAEIVVTVDDSTVLDQTAAVGSPLSLDVDVTGHGFVQIEIWTPDGNLAQVGVADPRASP